MIHFGELFACEKTEFWESAQIVMCLHSVNPCLIYREGLRFLKNYSNESSRSERKIHREREEIHVGSKHCFSLVMYGHCGNKALYSASLSLMFIFLLTPFDTRDCYSFKSNVRLVLHIKMFLTRKACNVVL